MNNQQPHWDMKDTLKGLTKGHHLLYIYASRHEHFRMIEEIELLIKSILINCNGPLSNEELYNLGVYDNTGNVMDSKDPRSFRHITEGITPQRIDDLNSILRESSTERYNELAECIKGASTSWSHEEIVSRLQDAMEALTREEDYMTGNQEQLERS